MSLCAVYRAASSVSAVTTKHERKDGVDLNVFLSDETDLTVAEGKYAVEIK